jgi:hypothetical protein
MAVDKCGEKDGMLCGKRLALHKTEKATTFGTWVTAVLSTAFYRRRASVITGGIGVIHRNRRTIYIFIF